MRKFLLLTLFYLQTIIANDLNNQAIFGQAKEKGCQVSFEKQERTTCSSKNEKITIAPIVIRSSPPKKESKAKQIDIELIVKTVLSKLTVEKKKNKIQKDKLIEELHAMKETLKKVQKQLTSSNKKLDNNKNKLVQIQKKVRKINSQKNKIIKNNIKYKKIIKRNSKNINKKVINKKAILTHNIKINTPTTIHKVIQRMPTIPSFLPSNTSWIEITVEDNINIYELALRYYGNRDEFNKIYTANSDIIPSNYQITNGMALKIPITEAFQEQPMMLNSY